MRIRFGALAAAVLLTAGAASAQDQTGSTQPWVVAQDKNVEAEIVVRGQAKEWLLSVTQGGDIGEMSYVDSAPAGLNCGAGVYKYLSKRAATDRCWLRVRHKRSVVLSATDQGKFGVDWTVQWVGCRPRGDGALCELTMTQDASVGVEFRRLKPR
ncbi:MAG TPA: hypothetical protein VD929_06865 [Caulobacteraceae bacterium]|nr:hypothetical protein [Caulobacteraceae bacterium]